MKTRTLISVLIFLCICSSAYSWKSRAADPLTPNTIPRSTGSSHLNVASGQLIDSDGFFQSAVRPSGPRREYSQQIEGLLRRMTIEEKVGQMTQLTLEMVVDGRDQDVRINPAKLQKAVAQYGVGSILNCYDQALTAEKWQELITQIQAAAKLTRLRVPVSGALNVASSVNRVDSMVQLYLSDLVASIAPPGKRLKRFAKIELQPGEQRTLNFTLRHEDLSFIGSDNKPVVEPGDFDVMIAGLRERFTLKSLNASQSKRGIP